MEGAIACFYKNFLKISKTYNTNMLFFKMYGNTHKEAAQARQDFTIYQDEKRTWKNSWKAISKSREP
ncbi:hypothetical protein [Acetobacter orleanensis]|uniref:Uncharacterized protein n=1 Tax=Acetobacter orleanensis TaxID=104099 RepID=A0A4Y3TN30_9PROT|nr:hypothetical protein [Acetobacter orleanensis]KXV62669.1 hypothetical protein AD949_09335 [Acetobacter orleanensis]PCD79182.1 hypothetical protein CO710_07835 [Acetobacter orleanensis]GAN68631.1 hypothetical protein Abol_020_074 [Acetobacter orleanensis JCM 7639]GBR27789.1 hypothetical protein AA0473_1538 [Acetobacter orleanensis NRIC 0473]GEB83262.1 hypothetical protein AOR01nite_17390 [Acetobacter orleanensis]